MNAVLRPLAIPHTRPRSATRRVLLVVYGTALAVLAVAWIATSRASIAFGDVSRDAIAVLEAPPWIGALSAAGVLGWCAAAAICLHASAAAMGERRWFLLHAGLLSTVLTLDDLYLLHEVVAPTWFGIRQRYVYVAYAAVAIAFVIRHAPSILTSSVFPLFASAIALLGASMVIDLVPGIPADASLIEDGAKLLGIAGWLAFFACEAASVTRP